MKHYELEIDLANPDEDFVVEWMQQHGIDRQIIGPGSPGGEEFRLISQFGPPRARIPIRAVSNRVVYHEVTKYKESGGEQLVSAGPRPDWSWQTLAKHLEDHGYRVTIHRGKGRNNRIIYVTTTSKSKTKEDT